MSCAAGFKWSFFKEVEQKNPRFLFENEFEEEDYPRNLRKSENRREKVKNESRKRWICWWGRWRKDLLPIILYFFLIYSSFSYHQSIHIIIIVLIISSFLSKKEEKTFFFVWRKWANERAAISYRYYGHHVCLFTVLILLCFNISFTSLFVHIYSFLFIHFLYFSSSFYFSSSSSSSHFGVKLACFDLVELRELLMLFRLVLLLWLLLMQRLCLLYVLFLYEVVPALSMVL